MPDTSLDFLQGHKPDCASTSIVGCEIRGFFDGVAYWQCRSCGAMWDREGATHETTATVPHPVMGARKLLGDFKERY